MADLGEKIGFQRVGALGFLACLLKLPLDFFPMGEVAQNRAKTDMLLASRAAAADLAKRHKDRDRSALPGKARDLAPLIEQADIAIRFQSFEI